MNETKIVPRGLRNNNPLNIRKGSHWQGERAPQKDKEFEEFQSLEMGLRAGFVLLRNYIEGTNSSRIKYNSVRKIISRWAPPSENRTDDYVDTVCRLSGLYPDESIHFRDRSKMLAIVDVMCRVECGQRVAIDTIASAYDLV